MPALTLRHIILDKMGRLSMRLSIALALLLFAPLAIAQKTLGELLDAGARKMTPEDVRQELVQRVIVGPLNSQGGKLEVMYADDGQVQGIGQSESYPRPNTIGGDWKFDDSGRMCTSMHFEVTFLPYRCQFWFKYGELYFLADSDSDRRAQVLRRTIKQ